MSDTNIRYFIAISENKRQDLELRNRESKIDDLRKKMLTKYWKDKIGVFDEMIRLNVKTPRYDAERALASLAKGDNSDDETQSMTLGPMSLDSKLLSNRPVTLQRGNKGTSRIEPVISIEGTDAVCYPNKEAKRGRKVTLSQGVLRRLEQCRTVEESIASIKVSKTCYKDGVTPLHIRRNGSPFRRPRTAWKQKKTPRSKEEDPESRPDTCIPGLEPADGDRERRPSTSMASYKREGFITSASTPRPATSGLVRISKNITPRKSAR